nr:hypothetical protein [uncultured Methanobacterium sp.]
MEYWNKDANEGHGDNRRVKGNDNGIFVVVNSNLKARYTEASEEYNNTTGVLTVPEGVNQVYIVNNNTALVLGINEEFNIPIAATGDSRGHDEYNNNFGLITSITITPGSSFIIELSG